jgi:hypothetical protein
MVAWRDETFQMSQLCVCLALSVAASRETPSEASHISKVAGPDVNSSDYLACTPT